MSPKERPHVVWTAIVLLGVASLGGIAWWLWARPSGPAEPGDEAPHDSESDEAAALRSAEERAAAELANAKATIAVAIERSEFTAAHGAIESARKRVGENADLDDLSQRLDLRLNAYRSEIRSMEFRIDSFESDPSVSTVFARYTVRGTPVFSSSLLVPNFAMAPQGQHANFVTLRTSLDKGVSIELIEPAGYFGSDETLLGPLVLEMAPDKRGGRLTFEDPDALVRRLVISYRPSPYKTGLNAESSLQAVPADATSNELLAGLTAALDADRLKAAEELLERLRTSDPEHPDAAFAAKQITNHEERLRRNVTVARFVVVEACCDPRPSGKLWASSGDAPSFRVAIHAEERAYDGDGKLAPYIVPGIALDPPPGNVITMQERGDAPLHFEMRDTSPTFGSSDVGATGLGISLSDLPRGKGTLVIERDPSVLILPESDENRLRRLVLRWTVER